MVKNSFKALLFLSFSFGALFSCENQSSNDTRQVLRIGMETAYPPFNWSENTKTDENVAVKGKSNEFANGYDVYIAKKIAESNDMRLEVVALSWEGLIPAIQNGTINAICAGMSVTDERKQSIDFTDPYYTSTLYLVTRKDDARFSAYDENTNFDFQTESAGIKYISQSGVFEDEIAEDWTRDYGATHIEGTNDYPTAFLNVANRIADAVICEYPVAKATVANRDDLKMVAFDNSKLNDTYIQQCNICL